MKLGNIRLVRVMRVPRCVTCAIVNFVAEVTGNDNYRNYTVGILYITHPVDTFKWVLRHLGRLEK